MKWVVKNVFKPTTQIAKKALSKKKGTHSKGLNVSGTFGIFSHNAQVGLSIDSEGNVAFQTSYMGGITTGTTSLSLTYYQMDTNAPHVDKLNGPGYQIGGSVCVPVYNIPLAAGGDFNIIPDAKNKTTYFGKTMNGGGGVPGWEFHVEWGEIKTWGTINIFDVTDEIYNRIMEW